MFRVADEREREESEGIIEANVKERDIAHMCSD